MLSAQLNRALIFLIILLVAPAFAFGIVIAAGLGVVWLWAKLPEFQHWGLVVGVACYLAMGGVLVWAYRELTRQPAASPPPLEPHRE